MKFFYFVIISLRLFILVLSKLSNQKIVTCLLPFATKPCINDGQNLSCTFSLDSSERRKTCNLSSVFLTFTTSHVELFIIPQYYNQFMPHDKHIINKLIIEPNSTNGTYEYLHWPDLRILSIEIPADIEEFIILHDRNNLDISRIHNHLNNQYWHLQIWPTKTGKCERTLLAANVVTTSLYNCPYDVNYPNSDLCGIHYACLDNNPCYSTGYRQIVCRIQILRSMTRFEPLHNIPQYETIFIDILYNGSSIHNIDRKTFINQEDFAESVFITKRLVIIISIGMIQISPELFDSPYEFQVRIEHGECNEGKLLFDIFNDTKLSTTTHFMDYTTGKTGAIGCHIDMNDTSILYRYKPYISLNPETLGHIEQDNSIICLIHGLPPFNITWLRNNTPINIPTSSYINPSETQSGLGIELLNLGNVSKHDNGIEYKIIVTNRFGQNSAITRLNISYKPIFITNLQNRTVKKGSNVILEAEIDGNPTPDVYIHGENFHQRLYPTNDDPLLYQYTLENVQLNNSILYTFTAVSEAYQTNISQTGFLTILDSLYSINKSLSISVEDDENLNLTLLFSHSIIKIEVLVNDTLIDNSSIQYTCHINNNQVIFFIENISIEYNGHYKIQVWDILNQTAESLIRLQIYSPSPLIIYCYNGTMPQKLYIYILCRFQAKRPQIQWTAPNGSMISDRFDYVSINESAHLFESKLIIKKVQYEHIGIYTFQVKNNAGIVIRKINLSLKYLPPTMGDNNFNSERIYMRSGESYTFILNFNGFPWPNVTFFFNNKVLLSYSNPDTSPLLLTLKNLSLIDEGIYYARIMNSEGIIGTNRTEICIEQAPSFIDKHHYQSCSSIISVKPNATITLTTPRIKTGSSDPVHIIWYVQGKSINQQFNSNMLHAKLTLNSSLEHEQIGCVIKNRLGESAYFFKLNFLQPPRFIRALKKQIEVELNQNITLIINVTANPLPTIEWFYNKQIIENKSYKQYISNDFIVSYLILRNFTIQDIGNYSVIVENSQNRISSETQIILKSSNATFLSSETVKMGTTILNTKRSKLMCGNNVAHIIIIILMAGLIGIVCIPIIGKQKLLSTLFDCRKQSIDTNDTINSRNENKIT